MITTATKLRRRTKKRQVVWHPENRVPDELLVFCPSCKALEVNRFRGEVLVNTQKFVQKPEGIYHSCGSGIPCRLFKLM